VQSTFTFNQIGLPLTVAATFILFWLVVSLWVAKAKYILADTLFLRVDKYIKKYGMWALFEFCFAIVATTIFIYGSTVLSSLFR